MEIRIEPHTLERSAERGANKDEIIDVLNHGVNIPAKRDRLCRYKVYPFDDVRNAKYYKQKRIEVVYTIEIDLIITITVYVFYGKWEE